MSKRKATTTVDAAKAMSTMEPVAGDPTPEPLPPVTSEMAFENMWVILDHVQLVAHYMQTCIAELVQRATAHDLSKFSEAEFYPYAAALPAFAQVTYGSPEYRAALRRIKPAIQHHFAHNTHHPEHFGDDGVNGMDLLQVLEMVCDWIAASQRGGPGTLNLAMQRDRFGLDPQLYGLIVRTVKRLAVGDDAIAVVS